MKDTGDIDLFLASLDHLDVDWSRASRRDFNEVVSEVLVEPAVGAPLPFRKLSLEGVAVEVTPTTGQLQAARTGVTAARMAVASYGSLVLQSESDATEAASLFPQLHVVVLRAEDVVPNMEAAFQRLGEAMRSRPTSAVLATGPSATADMGALVRGAHGPEAIHVVLVGE
jgi:L-lactate dehydrogenase complex protein LldG